MEDVEMGDVEDFEDTGPDFSIQYVRVMGYYEEMKSYFNGLEECIIFDKYGDIEGDEDSYYYVDSVDWEIDNNRGKAYVNVSFTAINETDEDGKPIAVDYNWTVIDEMVGRMGWEMVL